MMFSITEPLTEEEIRKGLLEEEARIDAIHHNNNLLRTEYKELENTIDRKQSYCFISSMLFAVVCILLFSASLYLSQLDNYFIVLFLLSMFTLVSGAINYAYTITTIMNIESRESDIRNQTEKTFKPDFKYVDMDRYTNLFGKCMRDGLSDLSEHHPIIKEYIKHLDRSNRPITYYEVKGIIRLVSNYSMCPSKLDIYV